MLWFCVSPLRILPHQHTHPPFGSALLTIPSFRNAIVDGEMRYLVQRGGAPTAPRNPFRILFPAHSV